MSSDILFEASETFTASWFEPGLLQECTFEQCVQIGRNFATLAKFDIYLAIFRSQFFTKNDFWSSFFRAFVKNP